MPSIVAETFRRAAAWNLQNPARRGNVVHLEQQCELLAAGDMHGNRQVLNRLLRYADLKSPAPRTLVLQEVIHGPPDAAGLDRSVEVLLRAVRLMLECPRQLTLVMGNHDLAQASGGEIAKNGPAACKTFANSVLAIFPDDGQEVLAAINEFLLSLPLAVRCPNAVLLSHSLPSPGRLADERLDILQRHYEPADLLRGGAVYEWTWGRNQTPEQIEALAAQLGVKYFILGHRHMKHAWEKISPRCLTIASDTAQGCIVQFPTSQPVDDATIESFIKPLDSL